MDPIHAQTGVAQPSAKRGSRAGAGIVAPNLVMEGEASARSLELLCINTIRTLSMDAVQQANSGHPGTPMALAPLVYRALRRGLRAAEAGRRCRACRQHAFEQQDQAYRDSVLPPDVKARVSVEAGSMIGWERYVGDTGTKIGMHTFGSSAPIKDLLKKFGFTPQEVLAAAREMRGRGGRRHE